MFAYGALVTIKVSDDQYDLWLNILKISLMGCIANFSHLFAEVLHFLYNVCKKMYTFESMHRIRLFCCKCQFITFLTRVMNVIGVRCEDCDHICITFVK